MQISESDVTYDEVAPRSVPQPAAAVAEECLYQEVADVHNVDDELYQDTAAVSQHDEPQEYTEEEEYYQVRDMII